MSFKSFEEFLSLFPNALRQTNGRYKDFCPAHADNSHGRDGDRRSLNFWQDHEKIMIHCFAGCTPEQITAAKGLTMRDLFLEDNTSRPQSQSVIECTYDYTDENGNLLYQVVRYKPKTFKQRRPDGKGDWIWSLNESDPDHPGQKKPAVKFVLFHLPRIIEAISKGKAIFIVEGEKDVLNLEKLGVYATCNAMGAGKWKPEYSEQLKGAHIIVIPDNDQPDPKTGNRPGIAHANQICRSVQGKATEVYYLTLPGEKIKDASDWIEAGGTKEKLIELLQDLEPWEPGIEKDTTKSKDDDSDPYRFALTDTGNAERLTAKFGKIIRYCYERNNFIVWNGEYWKWDPGSVLMDMAKQIARDVRREAESEFDDDKRKRIYRYAIESESQGKRVAMVNLSKSEKGIPVAISQIDKDPWLFNVLNGTIELKTGSLHPHTQEDLLTIISPIQFDPSAKCERWIAFLQTVTGNKISLMKYLQRAVGYSLSGDTREQCLFFIYGLGKNGKSTFVNVIRKLMGGYGHKSNTSLFMIDGKKNTGPNEGLADLQGKRFVVASEIEDGQRLSVVLIKEMTGGESIRAERKYERGFEFQPSHKIWLTGNHKPIITDTTLSIWRRLKLVPFNITIPENERIKDFDNLLTQELSGILNWAITGCLEWQKYGLDEPQEVIDATEVYRHDQDVLSDFFEDCCVIKPEFTISKNELASKYEKWCEENKVKKPLSAKKFKDKLTEKGITEGRSKSSRYWIGITLIDQENQQNQLENLTETEHVVGPEDI